MKIAKIKIENFKSIKEIEFDIKKYGSSYTTMFLGINESGKSNVLEAMSFFDAPEGDFDYYAYHNQKDEKSDPISLQFSLAFEDANTCLNEIRKRIHGGDLLSFTISNIVKRVYLEQGEINFVEVYDFDIDKISKGLFIQKGSKDVILVSGQTSKVDTFKISKTKEDESFQLLTPEVFSEFFNLKIEYVIKQHEPLVTFWKPSKEYLISTEDLNKFAENINSKPALKNIFLLAGYESKDAIKNVIATIPNGQQRSKLQSKLQENLDKYVKQVWQHDIDIVIDLTETGQFTLSIKDVGEENKHDRLAITGRSEGARHFLSLILSLSIESKSEQRKNQLILIDEPEAHLHPSGIRDLLSELLKIGTNNFLFVSTHSPFLVDRKKKERNIIIKKNNLALTEKILIDSHTSFIDDEVLREAFGLEVYKDLLNPHSILVEGSSDKKILLKVLTMKGEARFGVTNGHGSNIDTLASKLNEAGISLLVILDDDVAGKSYKTKIIRIGGSYSSKNVLTIRDFVGSVVSGGTIEDMLGKNYVQGKFIFHYKKYFSVQDCDIDLSETEPFLEQMKVYLYKNGKTDNVDKFLENFKDELASDFNPTKGSFAANFPLLDLLGKEIIAKVKTLS